MTPFFYLRFELCLWYSFLYLKIVKIHFREVPPLVSSGLQNTWISEVKAVRSEFCPIHIKESQNSGFAICIELRIKFVWSHGLKCIF